MASSLPSTPFVDAIVFCRAIRDESDSGASLIELTDQAVATSLPAHVPLGLLISFKHDGRVARTFPFRMQLTGPGVRGVDQPDTVALPAGRLGHFIKARLQLELHAYGRYVLEVRDSDGVLMGRSAFDLVSADARPDPS